jgi:hypothetical protein
MNYNKNHIIYSHMNENSYDYLHSNILNISKNIHENLFQGLGTRLGLAAKEKGFDLLQRAHQWNRARHFSNLMHAQQIDNQIIHSQIQKQFGMSPRQIQNINYFGTPAEKQVIANMKSSVMAGNPNLARYAESSKRFTDRISKNIIKSNQRLNSPLDLSSLKSVPSGSSKVGALFSVNPGKAAESLRRIREIQRIKRKNQLISQGANRFRIGLETSVV